MRGGLVPTPRHLPVLHSAYSQSGEEERGVAEGGGRGTASIKRIGIICGGAAPPLLTSSVSSRGT